METTILARHGESELSVAGRTNGDPGVACGLTETGRAQARSLGELLVSEPLDLCVGSEFQRARETADLALEGREVPRLVLPELNDIRFGDFEGLELADYRAWARAHGPEEPAPRRRRQPGRDGSAIHRGYQTILARPERVILVVAHGLPVRYVLDAAAGRAPAPAVEQVHYAEPFRLDGAEPPPLCGGSRRGRSVPPGSAEHDEHQREPHASGSSHPTISPRQIPVVQPSSPSRTACQS